jgi:hypothetical protein
MRRALGRLVQVCVLVVALLGVARAGVALGIVRRATPTVVLPLPAGGSRAAPGRQPADSARVRILLQAARGTNAVACGLAASAVDGRSGWSSDGDLIPGGPADSLSRDVVAWVHQREVAVESVPLLRAAIADPDWCVRRLAAPLLGRVHDPSAMDAMLSALAGSDAGAREMAALALGFADDKRAVAPLVARLRDDSAPVRATAAWALGEIEDTAGIVPLTDVLKSDRSAAVRRAAARALGEIAG